MTHRNTKRRLFKYSQKIREVKTIVISFLNRTADQLQLSLARLKERYKKVSIIRKLVNGLYSGSIVVTN